MQGSYSGVIAHAENPRSADFYGYSSVYTDALVIWDLRAEILGFISGVIFVNLWLKIGDGECS